MKAQSPIKKLQELETHYERMLSGVRSLIALENGQPIAKQKRNGQSEDASTTTPFSELTKAEAITKILEEKGEMHAAKLFTAMKRRGHPIASKNSLSNLLSTDKRFERKGKGVWALATQ